MSLSFHLIHFSSTQLLLIFAYCQRPFSGIAFDSIIWCVKNLFSSTLFGISSQYTRSSYLYPYSTDLHFDNTLVGYSHTKPHTLVVYELLAFINLQSFSQYFDKFRFPHKQNDEPLLLINMICTSCLKGFRTT